MYKSNNEKLHFLFFCPAISCTAISMVRHFHVRHFILSRPTCMYSIMHVDMYVFFMSPSLCPSYRWGRVVGPSVRAYAYVMGRRHSQTGLPTASSLCMCAHTVNKLDPPPKKKRTTRCGAQFNVSPPGCATSHWRDDSQFRG